PSILPPFHHAAPTCGGPVLLRLGADDVLSNSIRGLSTLQDSAERGNDLFAMTRLRSLLIRSFLNFFTSATVRADRRGKPRCEGLGAADLAAGWRGRDRLSLVV